MTASDYPVQLSVEYPEEFNRLTSLFRIILAIPIVIVLAAISGVSSAGGTLFIGPLLMILFRRKYPRWWFDWNRNLLRFSTRVMCYVLLLGGKYPSTDEDQSVRLDLEYPDAERDLVRWMPIVKWLLAIPHYVVMALLMIGMFFAVIIAWFAILFTGKMPRAIFDYQVGVVRYAVRVEAYALLLTTDRYPPFSISR